MAGLTGLRKFSTTIFKDAGASSSNQVVAVGASCNVYRQGAKVNGAPLVLTASPTVVNVRSVGRIAVGDTIQQNADETKRFSCTEVTSDTAIKLQAIGADIQLVDGDRLIIVNSQPLLYNNDQAAGSALSQPVQTDSRGYVEFYVDEIQFDMIVSGTGLTTTIYEDSESGRINQRRWAYNVKDFASVADALSSIPFGRRLYFPADGGPYIPPDASGWTISKPIEIFSDGPSCGEDKGFQYYASGGGLNHNSTVFLLSTDAVRDVYFRDLVISNNFGTPASDGTGDAIRVIGAGQLINVKIDNCWLLYAGRSGFFNYGKGLVGLSIKHSRIQSCGGHGVFASATAFFDIGDNSWFIGNGGMGVALQSITSVVNISGSTFESNGARLSTAGAGTESSSRPNDLGPVWNAQLYIENSHGVTIMGNNIEDAAANPTHSINGLTLNLIKGGVVGGNLFANPTSVANSVGIQLRNGTSGCSILANQHSKVDILVQNGDAAAGFGNVIHPQAVINADATALGRVVQDVNGRDWVYVTDRTTGTNIANNKGVGLLLPNLATGAGAISVNDAGASVTSALFEGMIAYNSVDNKLYLLTAANTWTVVGTQT
jgi:hypothetical protein